MRRRLAVVAGAVLLAGCELPSFGAPDAASREGGDALSLWKGFIVTAIVVALIVYALIAYAAIRYRRRDDTLPNQKAANHRMEIIYTVTPVLIVAVLFGVSGYVENRLTANTHNPPMTVNITGFQWGWKFEYPGQHVTVISADEQKTPELDLPVDQKVQLVLRTNDVNHSFWVPNFLEKRDLIAGVDNKLDITPNKIGRYDGRCAEFCGLDHWRMNFVVNVVSQSDFSHWVKAHQ
ncbi:MAG TPA: cytochrome c oxidase subunit II [Acidimicrobiales bacterium]|nr:cytochrome c oxidase subunit II [Acidimicrobiales bacterium]